MSVPWFARDPRLAAEIEQDLGSYPQLHLVLAGPGQAHVRGGFPVRSADGKEVDHYLVRIELPDDYPDALPIVFEVGERIPRIADRHINPGGSACVMLPDDRWRSFPPGARFRQFLDGPMHQFFLAQSLVELGEPWPFGQWSHGAKGRLEYYQSLFSTTDFDVIKRTLGLLAKLDFKPHVACPCGRGRRVRECCASRLRELRRRIPPEVALSALGDLTAKNS